MPWWVQGAAWVVCAAGVSEHLLVASQPCLLDILLVPSCPRPVLPMAHSHIAHPLHVALSHLLQDTVSTIKASVPQLHQFAIRPVEGPGGAYSTCKISVRSAIRLIISVRRFMRMRVRGSCCMHPQRQGAHLSSHVRPCPPKLFTCHAARR